MSVEIDKGGGVYLLLGDLLTAEEPVWVWDLQARRILWANRAGQAFWGAQTLESLRQRRFNTRNKSLARMAALALDAETTREWTEPFTFPGAGEHAPVTCTMQTMEVAGGRPGLIVRALRAAKGNSQLPRKPAVAKASQQESAGHEAVLKRIAARLQDAQASNRRKARHPPASTPDRARQRAPIIAFPETAQDSMIRELAHELRNPLTVIIGFAERIRDSEPVRKRSKVKAHAETILEGAQLALEILGEFSNRLRQGGTALPPPEPADVKEAVASCVRLVAPLAKQAGLGLAKSMSRNLPRLRAEERALKQILLNVLLNAIRHQKTGGDIIVSARMGRDGTLRLAVRDDGIGMTKKEIKAALGGKQKPDHSFSQSGLGLPLVRRLVETAGGSLSIQSARRKGTSVEIHFPRACLNP